MAFQGVHRPDFEAQARVLAAGKTDHGRRQVQAEGVQPEVPQVSCDPPGPAAEVGDKTAARGPHVLGACPFDWTHPYGRRLRIWGK